MTGPCTCHPWLIAVARCATCGDRLCADCRALLGGADGSSRCVDCAAQEQSAALEARAAADRRSILRRLFGRRPVLPELLVPVEVIEQPPAPDEPGYVAPVIRSWRPSSARRQHPANDPERSSNEQDGDPAVSPVPAVA